MGLPTLARRVGVPALLGAGVAAAAVVAGAGPVDGETAFALSALLAGFGTAAWGGARLLAPNVERATDRHDPAATARAMARLAAAGAGGMVGATASSILL